METNKKQKIISWVEKAFENEHLDSIDCQFPEYDVTGGYAAEIVYVDVKTQKDKTTKNYHILVKKNKDNEQLMDQMNFRQIYRKEVYFYSTFIPYLRNFAEKKGTEPFEEVPHCYGTVNDDKKHFVILMENLKPKNYKCHPLGGEAMSLDHVKLVVNAYAKWHAFGFAVKDQKPEALKEHNTPNFILENELLLENLCKTITNELNYVSGLYKNENNYKFVEILQNLKANYGRIIRDTFENKDEFHVVPRHGDSWNNNFLFHYNEDGTIPDKVIVIDWQGGIMGSPMADLTQFLFYCCSRKELEHLDDILKLYYETLSEKLKQLGSDPNKLFPWDVCKKSFARYAPMAIAGVPICSRMCFKVKSDKIYDFADSIKDGDLSGIFGNELIDSKKYFDRIDGILKLAIERNYL